MGDYHIAFKVLRDTPPMRVLNNGDAPRCCAPPLRLSSISLRHSPRCPWPVGTRTLTVGSEGGPQIKEELREFDAEKMTYKYKITKIDNTVLPVISYSSFSSAAGNDYGSSAVTWRSRVYHAYPNNNPPSELNDDGAVSAVTNSYESRLQGIKKFVEE